MIVFVGFHYSGQEHLYYVRRSDRWLHCLTASYHFSQYQKVLPSPNTHLILFTASSDEQHELLHYVFDTIQESIYTLDFTFEEYRLIKWISDTKVFIRSKDCYAVADINTGNLQPIDGLQNAITCDITLDERYVAMTNDHVGFSVSLWDRKLDITKHIDLRQSDNSCWIESVAGWTPDERFLAVLANYHELWLIARDETHWYKVADLEYFYLAYQWSPDGQWLSYFRASDHGGPGTSFGMICIVNRNTLIHHDIVTINKGSWRWLSNTEIMCIAHDRQDIIIDVINVLTKKQTRLLSEHEPMHDFAFRD